jgi:hypothetical protein
VWQRRFDLPLGADGTTSGWLASSARNDSTASSCSARGGAARNAATRRQQKAQPPPCRAVQHSFCEASEERGRG